MSTRTKSILTFVGGVFTGIVFMLALSYFIARHNASSSNEDVVIFDKPQHGPKVTKFEVFQVLPDGSALASAEKPFDAIGIVVVFVPHEGVSYYDRQNIDVPSNKRVMQIGTYRYLTRDDFEKTVPIVEIWDK